MATSSASRGPTDGPALDAVRSLCQDVEHVLQRTGNATLGRSVRIAAGRLARPTPVVCVVGEFKQGKSSLVNALIGEPVCPVDDDIATSAITFLRYGSEVAVTVHRREGDLVTSERIAPCDVWDWVSERGNPDNRRNVERLDVELPNLFLERGPAVVDTPGVGGLWAGHATATLAFLPFADAVLFVTDASAEMSAPELEFLQQAAAVCPAVIVCVTKTDLYPEWRRVVELDRHHLDHVGLELPVVPLSSALRGLAIERTDPKLDDESGFPELLRRINASTVRPARTVAARRALAEVAAALTQGQFVARAELEALDHPEHDDALTALGEARERLEQLRGPDARWNVVLDDGITDLTDEIDHQFRHAIRSLLRAADEAFEAASSDVEWRAVARSLQRQLADDVSRAFAAVEPGVRDVQARILEVLAEEELELTAGAGGRPLDVPAPFASLDVNTGSSAPARTSSGVERATGVARDASGALTMFGILGRLLPAAAASLVLSNPFMLAAGALFGAQHLRSEQKHRLAQQRQEARTAFRGFVEEAQLEISKALADALREAQREVRDDMTSRVGDLLTAYRDTATRCDAELRRAAAAEASRRRELTSALDALDHLRAEHQRISLELAPLLAPVPGNHDGPSRSGTL